ncbi:MAG: agmatine deiminase family protein [Elusimicrobia bacterium]|nr:agmatine deiminase family protein [Elusimicrobiota bacterium]
MRILFLIITSSLLCAPSSQAAERVSFDGGADAAGLLLQARAAASTMPDAAPAAPAPRPQAARSMADFSHDATPAEIRRANDYNSTRHFPEGARAPFRPVEDTAQFAYILMSAYEQGGESANLRKTIASNLPSGVKLLILADSDEADRVRKKYLQWVPAERLIIAADEDTSTGFWARDSFPVPVYDDAAKKASVVAARYYRDFTSWDAVAAGAHAPIVKKDFTFVGGNLMADEDGNCFAVDSYRLFTATAGDLAAAYGCKTVRIMPHVHGIGDVDEVLKTLPGRRVLTNTPEYRASLESWGYKVVMLPTRPETYRTYANALIVRGTVFMPSYGGAADGEARQVYESLGYKVVPIKTVSLSDDLHGSIHCQTMAYPPMPEKDLLKSLGLARL